MSSGNRFFYRPLILLALLWPCLLGAAPTVITQAASDVSDESATLNGTINVNSVGNWLVDFEFGTDASNLFRTRSSEPFSIQGGTVGNTTVALTGQLLTQPGTTYYYRVRARDLDNSLAATRGAVQSFTTSAPSTPPEIAALPHFSIPSVSHRDAFLRADVSPGSSPARLTVRYGTNRNQLNLSKVIEDPVSPSAVFDPQEVSITLNNLSPRTTYYFQWEASNSEGTGQSEIETFRTTLPPTVAALPATDVLPNSAVLNGSYDPNGGLNALVRFEYGESLEFGNSVSASSILSATGAATHNAAISQLEADTLYFYRVVSRSVSTQTIEESQPRSFRTPALNQLPRLNDAPLVIELNAADATLELANFHTGASETTITLEYGTTPAFGSASVYPFTLAEERTVGRIEFDLVDLPQNTLFYYRFTASNAAGEVFSQVRTFETPEAPEIITGDPVSISGLVISVNGVLRNNGGSYSPTIEWGTTPELGNESRLAAVDALGDQTVLARFPVDPSTTYFYRFSIFDGFNTYYGETKSVTSTPPITLPDVGDPVLDTRRFGVVQASFRPHVSAESAVITSNGFLFPGGSDASFVVEYGTTNALGMMSTEPFLLPRGQLSFAHFTLYDLDAETTYFWRLKGTNSVGTVHSSIKSFTTLKAPLVNTDPAISVTKTSATLVGNISPDFWQYDLEFVYGVDPENLNMADDETSPDSVQSVFDFHIDTSNRRVTLPVSGLLPATTYYYRLKAGATSIFPQPTYLGELMSFTTRGLLEQWRLEHYGTEANSGDAADLASSDALGISNIVKYALGLAPQDPLPEMVTMDVDEAASRLRLTFNRDPRKTEITYLVEASNSLEGAWEIIATSTGGGSAEGVADIVESPESESRMSVEVTDSRGTNIERRRFIRLRIERVE